MSKGFWAIIAIIIVVFAGILIFRGDEANAPSGSGEPTNHVIGIGTSGVVLVEYGDYQCPFCATYHPIVKAVQQKYNDQITFQFRNLPLSQTHQHAFAAARAAEAAALQAKFWEMYDLLYTNQTTWAASDNPQSYFEQYAAQLGLDVERFKIDAASSSVNDAINADLNAFERTGERLSTPTFFLDGKKISAKSVDEFSQLIDEAIAAKQKQ